MAFPIYKTGLSFHSNASEALNLASKSFFGETNAGKVTYSIYEALYLLESKKARALDSKGKEVKFSELVKKADSNAYHVFRDLRDKGNILKEGLKFGADFRVYEKGSHPGKAHAKYLLYIVSGKKINILDFAAKARIAHSTNKILLLAIVDSEGDASYYDVSWKSQ
jgi:tRNA-intron endonuclease